MTELEEEVEDKSIKYADSLKYTISKFSDEEGYCWSQVADAYEKGALDFAEPREKRIAELEGQVTRAFEVLEGKRKQIQALGERRLQLQKDKGSLTDRVKELEAQIEKMKCCGNCHWSQWLPNGHCLDCGKEKKNWKLKGIKRK